MRPQTALRVCFADIVKCRIRTAYLAPSPPSSARRQAKYLRSRLSTGQQTANARRVSLPPPTKCIPKHCAIHMWATVDLSSQFNQPAQQRLFSARTPRQLNQTKPTQMNPLTLLKIYFHSQNPDPRSYLPSIYALCRPSLCLGPRSSTHPLSAIQIHDIVPQRLMLMLMLMHGDPILRPPFVAVR